MSAALPAIATHVQSLGEQPRVFLHCALFLPDGRTLGDETFRLVALQGQESISEPFELQLELHGNTEPAQGLSLDFSTVVGSAATVGIHYPAPASDGAAAIARDASDRWFQQALAGQGVPGRMAFFNGIAASFALERPGVYRLTLRPALWKLTLTNAYRVLRHVSVRDAIENLLKQHRLDFSVDALMGSDNLAVTRVQDWLQAGESDYEFLRRLMSKAHLYFFFTHAPRSHCVVFANRPAYPQAVPGGRPLRYCSTGAEDLGLAQADVITDYRFQQSLVSSAVQAVFTREEAAWEVDPVAGWHSYRAHTRDDAGELPFRQYQIYQYGCSESEVDHYADNTQAAIDSSAREFSGSSYCPFLRSGHQFAITQQPRHGQQPAQVQPALEGMKLVAISVEHEASADGSYQNKFRSADARGLVTPFSLQDTQQGVVLAKVVAHGSGTVAPGSWQRYALDNFDPQTGNLSDSDSSEGTLAAHGVCVRFSSDADDAPAVWVKLGASMQTLPEIGSSVLVGRAQDQSELPEIVNLVEANGTRVSKPGGWTANTNVGSSYSTAYGDGQSIRFGLHSSADLAAATAIVNGQYQSGQFRETSYSQGASYSYATSEDGANGLLSTSDSFGSTYSTHHGHESHSETVFDTTYNNALVRGDATNINTTGGTTTNISNQVQVNSESATVDSNSMEVLGAHMGVSATGASFTASASGVRFQGSLEGVSVSSTEVSLTQNTTIAGESVQVNATGMSDSTNVTGVASHVSLTGIESGTSLVGSNSNTSLSGIVSSTSLVGLHSETSLTGSTTRMNVVGSSTGVAVTGSSTDVSIHGVMNQVSIKGSTNTIDISGGGSSLQLSPGVANMHINGMSLTIVELQVYL
jgi:uncharacterized protein involved in type VI secretion and phage assembly